jgi:hypothetical protein
MIKMDAKKCDICSNFFVISKKINGDDFFATSMRLYDDRNDYINVEHKDYDICPICSKRILDFINCGRSYMSDDQEHNEGE